MRIGMPSAASILTILRRMQGTGYTNDDDSIRVAELTGIAEVAARGSEALDAAVESLFVSSADESLDDWDRLLSVPSDAQLSVAQRQARLVAFMRALPKMIEARLDGALDAWLGTTTGITMTPVIDLAIAHGCSPLSGLSVTRIQPGSSSVAMRVVDAMLRRGMPARAFGCKGAVRYADYASAVDRSMVRVDSPTDIVNTVAPVVAPLEIAPGGVLTDELYTELQAQALWKPYRGGTGTTATSFSLLHSSHADMVYIQGSCPSLTQVVIDADVDWGDRVAQAWLACDTAAITDSTIAGVDHGWMGAAKLGNDVAASGFSHTLIGPGNAADLSFTTVDAAGVNQLRLTNGGGSTVHFAGFVRCTPTASSGTTNQREPWVSTTTLSSTAQAEVARVSYIRNPSSSSYANVVAQGTAVRRVLYTGAMQKAAAGDTPGLVILDSSMDWRSRALLITAVSGWSTTAVKDASSSQTQAQSAEGGVTTVATTRVFLTGSGSAADATTQTARQFAVADYTTPSVDIWIWVDSTNGYLMAETKASLSAHAYSCAILMVTASPALGTPSGAALPTFPAQAPAAIPADFNLPQNWGCFAQGQSGAGASVVTAPPLGTIVDGALPARPVSWLVRERRGHVSDRLVDVRQKIYGQRKRLLSVGVANGATVNLDAFSVVPSSSANTLDQMDYRDRLVFIEGFYASTDITLGRGTQLTDASATPFTWTFYAGPYGNQTLSLSSGNLILTFEFGRSGANAFQSRLTVTNNTGGTRYLNLAVEATGFLGLTDRRLDGAAA